jgi:hypothetical protein
MKRLEFLCLAGAIVFFGAAIWLFTRPLPANQMFTLNLPENTAIYFSGDITLPTPAVATNFETVKAKMDGGAYALAVVQIFGATNTAQVTCWVKDDPIWLWGSYPQLLKGGWPDYIESRWVCPGAQS